LGVSQRVKKLVSKLHKHSANYAAKLVHTRHVLPVPLLTLIKSWNSPSLQPT
jgi:hypothetical protein